MSQKSHKKVSSESHERHARSNVGDGRGAEATVTINPLPPGGQTGPPLPDRGCDDK